MQFFRNNLLLIFTNINLNFPEIVFNTFGCKLKKKPFQHAVDHTRLWVTEKSDFCQKNFKMKN